MVQQRDRRGRRGHDGDHRRARDLLAAGFRTCAISSLSASSLWARPPCGELLGHQLTVSWSMDWVMVAITPILNSALTTSPPFMASFWARSATVIASPISTSAHHRGSGARTVRAGARGDCSTWRRGDLRAVERRAIGRAQVQLAGKTRSCRRPRPLRPSRASRDAASACGRHAPRAPGPAYRARPCGLHLHHRFPRQRSAAAARPPGAGARPPPLLPCACARLPRPLAVLSASRCCS